MFEESGRAAYDHEATIIVAVYNRAWIADYTRAVREFELAGKRITCAEMRACSQTVAMTKQQTHTKQTLTRLRLVSLPPQRLLR